MNAQTPATAAPENHISAVRQMLLATMADLRDPVKPMDVERAEAISNVAQTIINSAKVEVDYLRATGQTSTPFLEVPPDAPYLTSKVVALPSGAAISARQHRMQG
jgi:hypothetical protein